MKGNKMTSRAVLGPNMARRLCRRLRRQVPTSASRPSHFSSANEFRRKRPTRAAPAHEAPRLAETAGAGGVPELRLLLFDEHCRPPFYGIR